MNLIVLSAVQIAILIFIVVLLFVRKRDSSTEVLARIADVRAISEKVEQTLRDEIRGFRSEATEQTQKSRQEAAADARSLREELLGTVNQFGGKVAAGLSDSRREQSEAATQLRESVGGQIDRLISSTKASSENLRTTLESRSDALLTQVTTLLNETQRQQVDASIQVRGAVQSSLVQLGGELRESSKELSATVQSNLAEVSGGVTTMASATEQKLEAIRQHVATQLSELRTQLGNTGTQLTESVQTNFGRLGNDLRDTNRQLNENVQQRLVDISTKVADLAVGNERSQETLKKTVEGRLDKLNEANSKKLDEMRQTVDEKLHSTLEKRLTDSFGLVTEQLGAVQRGLGEMKDLANGVGDLKRVLTNVKARGGYGEVQLGMLLDQMLAPEQYVRDVILKKESQEKVEFAIKLPGTQEGETVFLPVDAKFPREAWERLEDARTRGDLPAVEIAGNKFEAVIKAEAKRIGKYLEPPTTTTFAVMFLATEGLFAEVVRRPGLVDDLQNNHHVCVAGPTTFAALLTSLQMGFRTLALQKKGSEVWKILASTKVEFTKFGNLMDSVEKQVGTVQNTLKKVNIRTRAINRNLKEVEILEIQPGDTTLLLDSTGDNPDDAEDNAADEGGFAAGAAAGE